MHLQHKIIQGLSSSVTEQQDRKYGELIPLCHAISTCVLKKFSKIWTKIVPKKLACFLLIPRHICWLPENEQLGVRAFHHTEHDIVQIL